MEEPLKSIATNESVGFSVKIAYDAFVIGGGPGGIAFAKEAALAGAKVGISQIELNWGSDERMVKTLHRIAVSADSIPSQADAGWRITGKPKHNWQHLQKNMSILRSILSKTQSAELKSCGIDYFQSQASFVDPHTLHVYLSRNLIDTLLK